MAENDTVGLWCKPRFRERGYAPEEISQLIGRERFDAVVQATRVFLQRIVRNENRANGLDLILRRWRNEKRRQQRVIAMKLLDQPQIPAGLPHERKKNPLLDPDVSQKPASKLGIPERIDRSVGRDDRRQQRIEALVVIREQLMKSSCQTSLSTIPSEGDRRLHGAASFTPRTGRRMTGADFVPHFGAPPMSSR